ncbi:tail fiber domain-containing protein [bacterium]|nr:tail fiber domain-containing protein [bacterium]
MSKGKTTTVSEASLPAFQEAQFKELFGAAKGVAQQPFVPYTGPMVAGFSPDQLQQFQATRGMFESGMGYDPTKALQGMAQEQFKPTIQPVTGFEAPTIQATQAPGAAQIGPVSTPQFRGLLSQDIGAYQSPYQQQVIDLAMGDIQRQADIARGSAQDRAIRAGAFGGSRSAVLEAESQKPYAEAMARTSAGLRQSGFEQAQQAAQADLARQQQLGIFGAGQEQQRALQQAQLGQQAGIFGAELGQQRNLQQAQMQQQRQMGGLDIAGRAALSQPQLEMQARAQRAGLLGGLQGQQVQGLGLLGQAGAQQQGLQQRAIDAQRGEFQRALGYGPQQIGLLQAGMGTPLISQTTTGQQKTGLGDVLGTGAQLLATKLMFSDERLKENIKPIGKSENGHNVYTWDWNDKAKEFGVNDPTTGVLAQEIIKYMPEAVSKHANGYYMVNYGVL